MIKWIDKIVNYGISSNSDPKEIGKIKIVNMVSLITMVVNFIFIFVLYFFTRVFIYPLLGCIIPLIYFGLLRLKFNRFSKYYFCITSNVLVFILANAYGKAAGMQYILLTNSIFAIVLFSRKERIARYTLFLSPILIFVTLELVNYSLLKNIAPVTPVPVSSIIYYLVFLMLIIFFYIIFTTYQASNEKSEKMISTKEQIFKQVILKEKMNKQKLLESIHYAKTIELSILPNKDVLGATVKDHFVIWKPKDIVGGDFYWLYPADDYFLLAVIDCTGHGVPGALMTMTVYTLLERIVEKYTRTTPSEIISYLNIHLHNTLTQNSEDDYTDYGVDIGVCYCNRKDHSLIFSGARNSLFYCRGGEMFQVHGDNQSVGYKDSREDYQYKDHIIHFKGDEVFYMFSDGFIDQIGGTHLFPFGKKRLANLISENYSKTMYEQQLIYDNELKMYQRGSEQLDDITLLGFSL